VIAEWIPDCRFDDDAIVFDWRANVWTAVAVESERPVVEHDGFETARIVVEWANCGAAGCGSGGFESIAGVGSLGSEMLAVEWPIVGAAVAAAAAAVAADELMVDDVLLAGVRLECDVVGNCSVAGVEVAGAAKLALPPPVAAERW